MSTVDNRVVKLGFDNAKFEKGISTSQKSLEKFNQTLDRGVPTQSLDELQRSMNHLNYSNISKLDEVLTAVLKDFSVLGKMGDQVIRNLTDSIMSMLSRLGNATIGQITSGGIKRALNIENAKFQLEGLKVAWEEIEPSISKAVDGTAYGLDAAAKVASQLVASDVKLGQDMDNALRSISGVAAMTNSTYEDIGNIYTTIAGNGRLMGDQLRQLSSRGMNAAAELGKQLGKTENEIRQMVSRGQIDFMTFANAMNDAFGEHAAKANETFTGSLSNMKAALSRIGADIATPALKELRDIFNSIRIAINETRKVLRIFVNDINSSFAFISKRIQTFFDSLDWRDITFMFNDIWYTIKNIAKGIWSVIKPITEAIAELFPKAASDNVLSFTGSIKDITKQFKITEETAEKLKNAVKTLLYPFSRIGDILKNLYEVAKPIISVISASIKTLFELFKPLAVRIGTTVSEFVKGIIGVESFDAAIEHLATTIKNFVGDGSSFKTLIDNITQRLNDIFTWFKTNATVDNVFDAFSKSLDTLWGMVKTAGSGILEFLKRFVENYKTLVTVIVSFQLVERLKQMAFAFKALLRCLKPFGGIENIAEKIDSLLGNINIWFTQTKWKQNAEIMNELATAVLKFTAAMFLITLIPEDKLKSSLGAVSILLVELAAVFILFAAATGQITKLMGNGGGLSFIMSNISAIVGQAGYWAIMSGMLLSFSTAIVELSIAAKLLSTISLGDMVKSIVALTVMMLSLTTIMFKLMAYSFNDKGVLKGIGQMIFFAIAIDLLAVAVKMLAKLDLDALIQGLIGVGSLIFALGLFTKFADAFNVNVGAVLGLLALAVGITVLSLAVSNMAKLDWRGLLQGLIGFGVILGGVLAFINLLTYRAQFLGPMATGMLIMSAALSIFTASITKMASLNLENLLQGLFGFAVILLMSINTFRTLEDVLPGIEKTSFAMILFAASITIMANAIAKIAGLRIDQLVPSVAALMFMMQFAIKSANGLVPSNEFLKMSISFVIFSMALGRIADALKSVNEMSLSGSGIISTIGAMVVLIGGLYALSGVVKLLDGADMPKATLGMTLISVSMLIMANAIQKIAEIQKIENLVPAIASLGIVIAVLSMVCVVLADSTKNILFGAAAMVIMGIAVNLMVPAFRKLSELDTKKLVPALGALLGAIVLLSVIAFAFEHFGVEVLIGLGGMLVAVGILFAFVLMFDKLINTFVTAIERFQAVKSEHIESSLKALAKGLGSFAIELAKFGPKSIFGAASIALIANALNQLAPALEIIGGVSDVSNVATVMGGLATGFRQFNNVLSGFNFKSLVGAAGIVMLAEAVSTLTTALPDLTKLNPTDISKCLEVLGKTFKEFGEALDATPFWGAKSRANGIGALVGNIEKLTNTLPGFIELNKNSGQVKNALETISSAFVQFGLALHNAPFWGVESRAEGISMLVASVETLAKSLPLIMLIDSTKFMDTMKMLGDGFKIFGNSIGNAPLFGADDRGAGIAALASSVQELAVGLLIFLTLPADEVQKSFHLLGGGFSTFGLAISRSSIFSGSKSDGMVKLVHSISILTQGLKYFTDELNADKAAKAIETIGSGFKSFADALGSTPYWGTAKRADGIESLIDDLDKLVPAIKTVSSTTGAATAITTIGDAFAMFAEALEKTGFWGVGTKVDAVYRMAESISVMVPALEKLGGANASNIGMVMTDLKDGFSGFGKAMDSYGGMGIGGKIDNFQKVSKSLTDFIPSVTKLADTVSGNISTKLIEFAEALRDFLNSLTGFEGITKKLDGLETAMFGIGEQTINGLIKGLDSKLDILKTKLEEIGAIIPDTLKDVLEIHSPCRLTMEIADRVIEGLILPMKDTAVVKGIAKKLGYDTVDALADAIKEKVGNADFASDLFGALGEVVGLSNFSFEYVLNDEDYFNDILKKFGDAEEEASKTTDKLTESLDEVNPEMSELASTTQKATEEIDVATDIFDYASGVVHNFSVQLQGLTEEIGEELPDNTEIASTAIRDFAERLYNAKVALGKVDYISEDDKNATLKRAAAIKASFVDLYNGVKDTVKKQMSIFKQFNKEEEITPEDLIKNMESQLSGITTWSNNLATLAGKGLSEPLLEYLAELGPQGAHYVDAFMAMTDEQLKSADNLYAGSLKLSTSVADEVVASFAMAAQDSMLAMEEEVANNKIKVEKVAFETGEGAAENLKKGVEEGKPEEAGEELDEKFAEGITNSNASEVAIFNKLSAVDQMWARHFNGGVPQSTADAVDAMWERNSQYVRDSGSEALDSAAEDLSNELVNDIDEIANNIQNEVEQRTLTGLQNFAEVGKEGTKEAAVEISDEAIKAITDGAKRVDQLTASNIAFKEIRRTAESEGSHTGGSFVAGMERAISSSSTRSKLRDAATRMANMLPSSVRKALGIYSPSRVMYELGEYSVDGLANALVDGTKTVGKASEQISDVTIDTLADAFSSIIDLLATNMDLNPVIAPVVNLDNVLDGAEQMNSLFGGSYDMGTNYDRALNAMSIRRDDGQFKMDVNRYGFDENGKTMGQDIDLDNTDVVNAINRLYDNIEAVAMNVRNLQVVMDTGVLVGSIQSPLDYAMGNAAARNRREKM